MHPTGTRTSSAPALGTELVTLLHRLGFAVLVRDPDSAEVVAASPAAESAILAAPPGSVRMATGRVAGELVRVEMVRVENDEWVELTARQAQVGRLLIEGLRNREIAERLNISSHTVRRHLEELFRRLKVRNRAAAAAELKKGRAKV